MTTLPTKDELVERFVAIAHSSHDDAVFYLRFANGNFEQAIENYFADESSDGETSKVLPPPPPRFNSPQPSGFLSPPLPYRKHSGDSDHEHDREGSSVKRVHTPTKPLPEVYTPSGAVTEPAKGPSHIAELAKGPSYHAEPAKGPSNDAEPRKAPSNDADPAKGPSYHTDLALASILQHKYDAQASDQRLGWGSHHPSVTKPKGSFPDHWIRNPNWANLGAQFNTSLGGVNRSIGAIPSDPHPEKATRCLAPEEILSPLTWEQAMEIGVREERWMLINIQDPAIPHCNVLNRDIWNDPKVIDLVKEKFTFLQCRREEYRAREYIAFHFSVSHLSHGAYPHIAVLDPRNGEQLKLWTGYVPKAKDFIADLREFLELYSLNPRAKNPIGTVKGGQIKARTATEGEAEEPWYIQSVEQPQSFFDDLYVMPGADAPPYQKGNTPTTSPSPEINVSHFEEVAFSSPIMETLCLSLSHSSSSHTRPGGSTATATTATTIINFRRPSGQSRTHTFSLSDPVRAMYEWLESMDVQIGKMSEANRERTRLRLSFEGRDISEALNERIGDIPGLVDNINGGESVNVFVEIINEGLSGEEMN